MRGANDLPIHIQYELSFRISAPHHILNISLPDIQVAHFEIVNEVP